MSSKKSYNRFFIIFQEEDKGFGIAIDKQPTGYTKIETRNGRCKITVYVQNLSRDKGPYVCRLMDPSKDNVLIASLGEIKLDETGRGEAWWEYKEEDIAETGNAIEKFGVAAIMVEGEKPMAPLAGYAGKEKLLWKEKLVASTRHHKEKDDCKEKANKEMEEEAEKFKEYEEMLKKDLEEIHKKEQEKEEKYKHDHDDDDDHKCKHDDDDDDDDHKCKHDHDDDDDDDHKCKHDDDDDDHKCKHDDDDDDHKHKHEEKDYDVKDMNNNCQWTDNLDSHIKYDKNKSKYHENADAFHKILKDYSRDKDLEEEIKDTRWWKIPYNEYDAYKGDDSYEHYCAVHHLKMAYPYMNYIKYFKKCGYSYFGMKYDRDEEVKYLMYGIEGDNNTQDQPYMGMTGFVKWMKPKGRNKGIWIMYYNPYNGCIMIPKTK